MGIELLTLVNRTPNVFIGQSVPYPAVRHTAADGLQHLRRLQVGQAPPLHRELRVCGLPPQHLAPLKNRLGLGQVPRHLVFGLVNVHTVAELNVVAVGIADKGLKVIEIVKIIKN